MTMTLLSHILHPHPDISPKITLNEPLAGALLISPWAKFPTDDPSVKRNANSDMVLMGETLALFQTSADPFVLLSAGDPSCC
jgi:hypothetical protein